MEATQASQHVYVVKVRALPDPALLFPSERRYSALTVAGLAAGHGLLGGVALLLGALALCWEPSPPHQGAWLGHLGVGLWLGVAALQAALCGVLAWCRWYEDRYIAWFFRSSLLAAFAAGMGLVLTSVVLAHLHENVLSLPAPGPPHWPRWPHPGHGLDHGYGSPIETLPGDAVATSSPPWLDLADPPLPDGTNSSTFSSGGVFSDAARDQDQDLQAADSTQHDELAQGGGSLTEGRRDEPVAVAEWSVLRWVPLAVPPRASAQVRSLVAANVLVACFLELLWSLVGARLAWRGMRAPDEDAAAATAATATPPPLAVPANRAGGGRDAALAALERGAADGKVDVDTDRSGEPSDSDVGGERARGSRRKRRAAEHKEAAAVSSLHRPGRRRAPELPPATLVQRTMELEERVGRLLGSAPGAQATPSPGE